MNGKEFDNWVEIQLEFDWKLWKFSENKEKLFDIFTTRFLEKFMKFYTAHNRGDIVWDNKEDANKINSRIQRSRSCERIKKRIN